MSNEPGPRGPSSATIDLHVTAFAAYRQDVRQTTNDSTLHSGSRSDSLDSGGVSPSVRVSKSTSRFRGPSCENVGRAVTGATELRTVQDLRLARRAQDRLRKGMPTPGGASGVRHGEASLHARGRLRRRSRVLSLRLPGDPGDCIQGWGRKGET
jgi:hypothetical protein